MDSQPEDKKDLPQKKAELLEVFELIDDEYERLSYIIDMGRDAKPMNEEYRQDTFRIEGCTSKLWLFPSYADGLCYFQVDSDSAITKGIGTMLANLYSGHSSSEILSQPPDFLAEAGVPQLLSPNRRNGLSNLSQKIMAYAQLCQEKYPS